MQTERRLVPLADGRDIDVLTVGADDGFPLVVHEETPSGLVPNSKIVGAAEERGLRVVMAARPGYEGSTPRPGRRVADVVGDMAQVLDALGAGQFVSIGFSGGGPHSLACAALLPAAAWRPPRSRASAPTASRAWTSWPGMGPENVEEFGLAVQGADALTPFLEKEAAALGSIEGEQIIASLGGLISGADAGVINGQFADDLARSLHGAIREGIAGWRDDDLAFAADWGLDLDAFAAPVAIWQGDQDLMVPFAHGQWLAARIPGARAHLEPGAGHLTMTVTAIGRILDDLLDLAGRAPRLDAWPARFRVLAVFILRSRVLGITAVRVRSVPRGKIAMGRGFFARKTGFLAIVTALALPGGVAAIAARLRRQLHVRTGRDRPANAGRSRVGRGRPFRSRRHLADRGPRRSPRRPRLRPHPRPRRSWQCPRRWWTECPGSTSASLIRRRSSSSSRRPRRRRTARGRGRARRRRGRLPAQERRPHRLAAGRRGRVQVRVRQGHRG